MAVRAGEPMDRADWPTRAERHQVWLSQKPRAIPEAVECTFKDEADLMKKIAYVDPFQPENWADPVRECPQVDPTHPEHLLYDELQGHDHIWDAEDEPLNHHDAWDDLGFMMVLFLLGLLGLLWWM